MVIPASEAHAGIHTLRIHCLENVGRVPTSNTWRLWVPAFAGTTSNYSAAVTAGALAFAP